MAERHAVSRLREGDVSGLEVLVRDYQGAALRAAFLVTQDAAFAEDVVASAFLKAYDRIDQFDVRRSFGPWFLRIVVNDAKNAVASRSREVSADAIQAPDDRSIADTLADTGPGLEELAERAEARYAVGAALAKLSPKQREAVVLHYYLGLGQAEVADRLSKTEGTVKRHLYDARARLRTMLNPFMKGDSSEGREHVQPGAGRSDVGEEVEL